MAKINIFDKKLISQLPSIFNILENRILMWSEKETHTTYYSQTHAQHSILYVVCRRRSPISPDIRNVYCCFCTFVSRKCFRIVLSIYNGRTKFSHDIQILSYVIGVGAGQGHKKNSDHFFIFVWGPTPPGLS